MMAFPRVRSDDRHNRHIVTNSRFTAVFAVTVGFLDRHTNRHSQPIRQRCDDLRDDVVTVRWGEPSQRNRLKNLKFSALGSGCDGCDGRWPNLWEGYVPPGVSVHCSSVY
jgi:hypothetical protein